MLQNFNYHSNSVITGVLGSGQTYSFPLNIPKIGVVIKSVNFLNQKIPRPITQQKDNTQKHDFTKYSPQFPIKSIKDHPMVYHTKNSMPSIKYKVSKPKPNVPDAYMKSRINNHEDEPIVNTLKANRVYESKPLRATLPSDKFKLAPVIPAASFKPTPPPNDPSIFVLPTEDSYKEMTTLLSDVRSIIVKPSSTKSAQRNISATTSDTDYSEKKIPKESFRIKIHNNSPIIQSLKKTLDKTIHKPSTPRVINVNEGNQFGKAEIKSSRTNKKNKSLKTNDEEIEGEIEIIKSKIHRINDIRIIQKLADTSENVFKLSMAIPDVKRIFSK